MNNDFSRMLSDRLGMFVHFGLYSAFAGKYNGKEIEGLGEWIQRLAEIPISEYEAFGRANFCPDRDFAKNLVKRAKAAGFRYIVLTSKHHDGFCLFKSAADSYNSYEYFGRDLCRELVDACREEGLEVGFYYSHALDWHEKNAGGNYTLSQPDKPARNRNFWDFPDDNIDYEEYFRRKCMPQVRELLSNYGNLKCIWFDYPHDISQAQSLELRNLVKELQPNCLINSRIGHGLCDYFSLGDNGLPNTPTKNPTECLITVNRTWGYKENDHDYTTPDAIINIMCRTLSTRATLLLNVGPMPDGSLTPETEEILSVIGEWTGRNSEAIYGGIKPNPYKTVFDWGCLTVGKNAIYIYSDKEKDIISISGIKTPPISASLLGDERQIDIDYAKSTITLKTVTKNILRPVYKISFSEDPQISNELEIDSTRCSLPVAYAFIEKRNDPGKKIVFPHEYDVEDGMFGKRGTSITRIDSLHHWESSDDTIVWNADFLECGEYRAEIIYAEPSFETYCSEPDSQILYKLTVGEQTCNVSKEIKYSFNINSASSETIRYAKDGGNFKIENAGKYTIKLSKESDELGLGLLEVRFIKI